MLGTWASTPHNHHHRLHAGPNCPSALLQAHPDSPAYTATRYAYVHYARWLGEDDADVDAADGDSLQQQRGQMEQLQRAQRGTGWLGYCARVWCGSFTPWESAIVDGGDDGVPITYDVRSTRRKQATWRAWCVRQRVPSGHGITCMYIKWQRPFASSDT